MSKLSKILVPFDFSDAALGALEYTLNFVGWQRPIQVMALYVSPVEVTERQVKEIEENFTQIIHRLGKKTHYEPQIKIGVGQLEHCIKNHKKETASDLVIMGTQGNTNLEEPGSNTADLVLKMDSAMISFPLHGEIKIPKEIALVLGKEEIEQPQVLELLLEIARIFDAKVHVLTIYKESIFEEHVAVESNEDSLEYYLENFYSEHNFEKNEDIEQGILNYIEEKSIDLLAIIPRNHAQKTKPSEGRLTKLLTLHARVPILTLDYTSKANL